MCAKMGSLCLASHAHFIEAYDCNLMRNEWCLEYEIKSKRRTYTYRVAVMKSENCHGLIGRDITQSNRLTRRFQPHCILTSRLRTTCNKKMKPKAKPMFCHVGKVPIVLQDQLMTGAYQLPDPETLFQKVNDDNNCAKMDLLSSNYQIELVDEAQKIATINTTQGLYRAKKFQQDMKKASVTFQEKSQEVLNGLSGKFIFQNDVLKKMTINAESNYMR